MFTLFPGYNETPMTELALQIPSFNWGSAFAPDFNNDGVLDLYHHNHLRFHYAKRRWSDPSISAVGPKDGGCMVDWDAVLRNDTSGAYYAVNIGKGFIETSDEKVRKCFDSHSSAFLDIDGDGIKDFFQVTGGGRGRGNSTIYDNILYWGETDSSELGFRLVGGRDAAIEAGLHGRNSNGNQRGRHQYWFDADGDGFLDVVTLNTERKDGKVSPGLFYRNIDGRRFTVTRSQSRNFEEFASIALLTDVEGDGFAKELVVPSLCSMGAPTNPVCKKSPRQSLSVYQFDRGADNLLRRTLTQKPPRGVKEYEIARGIASVDVDLDGKLDVAVLWDKRVDFFFSSNRNERCMALSDDKAKQLCLLHMGEADMQFNLTTLCGEHAHGAGIRFADFDLNGNIDMLVICGTRPGRHGIFELEASKTWRPLKNSKGERMNFGDLNSPEYGIGPKGFCNGIPTTTKDTRKSHRCKSFLPKNVCRPLRYKHHVALCSIFKHQRYTVRAVAPTVADLDNDSFSDIIVGYRYGTMVMLRNMLGDSGNRNRFLAVSVDRRAGAAASIGAIVQLSARRMGHYKNETTTQLRVVATLSHETDSDGGSEDRIIFGLGVSGVPTRLRVQWPHCCRPTVIWRRQLEPNLNSMDSPFEVPPPGKDCDTSCFQNK